jgi:DNA helicase-2/ATP-dependent DNA helicase PcrA
MVDEAALAGAERGSVVAPAGCGKTELIARTVKTLTGGCALVLTHTHAGVKALRDRLKQLGVKRERVHVETIAGWCHRYSRAYPAGAGNPPPEPEGAEWSEVYRGAALLIRETSAIRAVVAASYSRAFIDEYQDCTDLQHEFACALADVVPCCVLGDPLQGIFGFAGGDLSWREDVGSKFPPLGELDVPWRWKAKNERLGEWLLDARCRLIAGDAIDLSAAPLRRMVCSPSSQRSEAFRLMKESGQVVAISKWPRDAHDFARHLAGAYPSMEEIDCKDLLSFARDIDGLAGTRRATRILDFASECMTEVSSELATIRGALEDERFPDPQRLRKHKTVAEALIAASNNEDSGAVLSALRRIEEVPGVRIFRSELWLEAARTLIEFERGGHKSRHGAAWAIRNRVRARGRALGPRLASRTLLIKGLEFDHALVLNADAFEDARRPGDGAKHFYVAITRAARTLAVLSARDTVRFSKPPL